MKIEITFEKKYEGDGKTLTAREPFIGCEGVTCSRRCPHGCQEDAGVEDEKGSYAGAKGTITDNNSNLR